jgi:hypothetical protein
MSDEGDEIVLFPEQPVQVVPKPVFGFGRLGCNVFGYTVCVVLTLIPFKSTPYVTCVGEPSETVVWGAQSVSV